MSDPQCVLLHDVLYVGGRTRDRYKMFVSKIVTKPLVWDVCRTPTELYALTTYHSQLVLVGGATSSGQPSNMLWTLSSDSEMNWQSSIKDMPTKRWGASAMNTETPEYLVVAGGVGVSHTALKTVEVFTGKEWCTIEHLLKPCYYLKSTKHEGKYFLCGGDHQGSDVYSCDHRLLLESCEQSGISDSLWSPFQGPLRWSSPASFGQHLISIGGGDTTHYSDNISVLYPHNQSWVHVGKLPFALHSAASIVLPTGELVVIGGETRLTNSSDAGIQSFSARVFKATLKGKGDDVTDQ